MEDKHFECGYCFTLIDVNHACITDTIHNKVFCNDLCSGRYRKIADEVLQKERVRIALELERSERRTNDIE